jgi:hypothetical protein
VNNPANTSCGSGFDQAPRILHRAIKCFLAVLKSHPIRVVQNFRAIEITPQIRSVRECEGRDFDFVRKR